MADRNIICFDFETGGKHPETAVPLSIAGKAYNGNTLNPYPNDEGEFSSLMKPKDDEWKNIEAEALKVNKLTIEELREAPEREVVWREFMKFVTRFNKKGAKNFFTAPIPAGQNIIKFDLIIAHRLCQEFDCPVDAKEKKPILFHRRDYLDLQQFLFTWFENQTFPKNNKAFGGNKYNMNAVRKHWNLTTEVAHTAIGDVRQSGTLIMKFLKMQRTMFARCPGLLGT